VNEDARRERISIGWSPEARSELRAINRETAMQILNCIDRYVADRAGDVKKLKPPITGLRLAAAISACSLITASRTRLQLPASAIAAKLIDKACAAQE
jgi:hypothetical protein